MEEVALVFGFLYKFIHTLKWIKREAIMRLKLNSKSLISRKKHGIDFYFYRIEVMELKEIES